MFRLHTSDAIGEVSIPQTGTPYPKTRIRRKMRKVKKKKVI
jgi:hypothetical protein